MRPGRKEEQRMNQEGKQGIKGEEGEAEGERELKDYIIRLRSPYPP